MPPREPFVIQIWERVNLPDRSNPHRISRHLNQRVLILIREDHHQRVLRSRSLTGGQKSGLLATASVDRAIRRAAIKGHVIGGRATGRRHVVQIR